MRAEMALSRIGKIIRNLYWTAIRQEIDNDLCG